MHTITGFGSKSNAPINLVGCQSDIQLTQELNTFFTRFDVEDFSEMNVLRNETMCNMECKSFTQQDVIHTFVCVFCIICL